MSEQQSEPNTTVYIDTNCFIQLIDLKDIPWRDLCPGDAWIELAVAPVVVEELDNNKNDREGRRRDRSRAALDLIEKASIEKNFRLCLRKSPFNLTIRLTQTPRINWDHFPLLDEGRPDDQFVAAALVDNANSKIVVSHDTGPVIRARFAQLIAHRVPEGWLLPETTVDSVKELQRTRRELEFFKSTKPLISAEFGMISEDQLLVIPHLLPLSAVEISMLHRFYLSQHPMEVFKRVTTPKGFEWMHFGPSEAQIDEYERNYASFADAMRKWLSELHGIVSARARVVELPYVITNEGSVTAEKLIVEMELDGCGVIVANDLDAKRLAGQIDPPKPPTAPSSQLQALKVFPVPDLNRSSPKRGIQDFFWEQTPVRDRQRASLRCDEFRALRTWSDQIQLMPNDVRLDKNRLTFKISASNMPRPELIELEFGFEGKTVPWLDPSVSALVPSWISNLLTGLKQRTCDCLARSILKWNGRLEPAGARLSRTRRSRAACGGHAP